MISFLSILKKDKRVRLVFMTLLSIVIFTLIYLYCNDEEFITWIGSYYQAPTERIAYLNDLFDRMKVGKKGDRDGGVKVAGMMSKKAFMDLPIFKETGKRGKFGVGDIIYILREHDVRTKSQSAVELRSNIFDVLDNKGDNMMGYIPRDVFISLPVNMKYIGKYVSPDAGKINYTEIAANKNYKFGFIDRLYFSVIIQSTVGFGDVVPASRRVRIIATLQALSTLLIVAFH